MNILKLISSAIKSLVSTITPKKGIEYQVEHTLDFIHDIKKEEIKEESPEVEAEKTLIEAKSKLREKRKAPKKIKVPKDIV